MSSLQPIWVKTQEC